MIDIKLIREEPDKVRESQKKRNMDSKDVDEFLKLDKKWREAKFEVDNLRSKRNKVSEGINQAKKAGKAKDAEKLIKEAKDIPKKIQEKEEEMKELEEKRTKVIESIPNIVDGSVPVGDPSNNKIIETNGKPTKMTFTPKGHEELLNALDCLDVDKASKVAGSRFYYLKRDLVKLNQAIINFALDYLSDKGFILMQPPYMLRKEALNAAIPMAAFEEMIYKIEGEDLYLIGTAEHALNAYHMGDTLNGKDLPLRYAGYSPCFRKEAGSHGKDTKGIFRIHQFEKIEQFVFCKPEDSWKEFEIILNNTRDLFKKIGIPFRVVVLSSGDMGRVPTKTIDLEGWFPSQNTYRELASCSNCLDYQARRSNTRFEEKGEIKFVHTLNNTAIATERMITCIVDNFQQKDGSIKVPEVLQKYMNGVKVIQSAKK